MDANAAFQGSWPVRVDGSQSDLGRGMILCCSVLGQELDQLHSKNAIPPRFCSSSD